MAVSIQIAGRHTERPDAADVVSNRRLESAVAVTQQHGHLAVIAIAVAAFNAQNDIQIAVAIYVSQHDAISVVIRRVRCRGLERAVPIAEQHANRTLGAIAVRALIGDDDVSLAVTVQIAGGKPERVLTARRKIRASLECAIAVAQQNRDCALAAVAAVLALFRDQQVCLAVAVHVSAGNTIVAGAGRLIDEGSIQRTVPVAQENVNDAIVAKEAVAIAGVRDERVGLSVTIYVCE